MDSNVFYRRLLKSPVRAVRGDGIFLYDSDGKEYIDGSGGALVVNVGHGVDEIVDIISSQGRKLAYVNGIHFTNDAIEELAAEIASFCPEGLNKVFTLGSGSAATEAAIKLARHYWWDRGKREKYKIVARIPGYHGNTLAALSASGRPAAQEKFGPLLLDFSFVPAPMGYRCPDGLSFEEFGHQCTASLEETIDREGRETIAAVIVEPVIGASAGAVVAPPRYFSRIREICSRNEILLIADEVLTGMGRTGQWLAVEKENLTPDILTLGKGLSGGYAPLSAVVTSEPIVRTIAEQSGAFSYNQTYSHTPISASAGLATIRYLKKHALVRRSKEMGAYLLERLQSLLEFEMVGDVRGIGLLSGIEYVADRESKKPFDPELKVANRVYEAAFEAGLILWPTSKFLESGDGDLSILGPPFIITRKQIDDLVDRLRTAIMKVSDELQSDKLQSDKFQSLP